MTTEAGPFNSSGVSQVEHGLSLTVGVRKDTILVGEPAVLSLRFKNTGDVTILLGGPLQQLGHEHNVAISISHESGLAYRHTYPMTKTVADVRAALKLLPGDDVEVVYVVGAGFAHFGDSRPERNICRGKDAGNAWCWDFPLPGEYEIAVKYEAGMAEFRDVLWKGPIEVNGVRVHVANPETQIDRVAFETWALAIEAMGRWRGPMAVPGIRQALTPLISGDGSSSRYAPFAHHLLALSSFDNWSAAEQQLLGIGAAYPDYVLLDEVLFDLASVQQRMGRDTEAATTKVAARELNPKNIRAKTYEELPRRW